MRSAMALKLAGRVRTLRRLVTAVVGLCDPQGSTAHEIIEWSTQHPCGTTHCQHPPAQGSEMRQYRARLLRGLKYSVQKGVLEEHGGRYKLAMEGGGHPQQGTSQEARPRVSWARRRAEGGRCRCRAYALSSRAHASRRHSHKHRHRHPAATSARRRGSLVRAGRRRQQHSRRRHPGVRHLRSGRDSQRRRAAASKRPRTRTKDRAKRRAEDKGKADGGASGGGGGGGCGGGGCGGEGRPERAADPRRASHLMFS